MFASIFTLLVMLIFLVAVFYWDVAGRLESLRLMLLKLDVRHDVLHGTMKEPRPVHHPRGPAK